MQLTRYVSINSWIITSYLILLNQIHGQCTTVWLTLLINLLLDTLSSIRSYCDFGLMYALLFYGYLGLEKTWINIVLVTCGDTMKDSSFFFNLFTFEVVQSALVAELTEGFCNNLHYIRTLIINS